MKSFLLALPVLVCVASPVSSSEERIAAPLPPLAPWKGASEMLPVLPDHPWATPGEKSQLTETPSYADTVAFIRKMVAASPLLTIETFGTTPQGRDMIALVARKPGGLKKPVLLAQAGIHSGEIDGKDAGLMLLRDIAFRGKGALLDKADFVFVPIFNIDGHERRSRFNRPNQRGPLLQGLAHDQPELQSQPRISQGRRA